MMIFFILELVFLPLYLLYIKILYKQGQLTENRFALLVVLGLGALVFTFSQAVSTAPVVKLVGHVLRFLCWFPGYLIAKWVYRRIFLHQ
jgi:hypothetical protein